MPKIEYTNEKLPESGPSEVDGVITAGDIGNVRFAVQGDVGVELFDQGAWVTIPTELERSTALYHRDLAGTDYVNISSDPTGVVRVEELGSTPKPVEVVQLSTEGIIFQAASSRPTQAA
jgi:hypothetical protein